MDLSDTIQPNSDQLDAVDLLTGPRTFTIERVTKGDGEQPVNIHLAEFPRPWRPGKSMRRVLVACWGADASTYVGRRVTLWCDPTVRFGGAEVGGTRITHLSHLDKPKTIPLLVTRGKSAPYRVQPLPADAAVTPDQLTRLAAAFKAAGITKAADGLAFLTDTLRRDIASSKELTEVEAEQILAALGNATDAKAEDPPADSPRPPDGEPA